MANDKFTKVIQLIRAICELIADLIPVADTALVAIESARNLIERFKEEQEQVKQIE